MTPPEHRLRTLLADMGGLAERALADAMRAVLERDQALAARVIAADAALDDAERRVEDEVLSQPDLPPATAWMAGRIAGHLERIGDLAANLAKRSLVLAAYAEGPLGGFLELFRLVEDNLRLTVDALGEGDAGKAEAAWRSDQVADDLHSAFAADLLRWAAGSPAALVPGMHLLFMAKNLERIGDHTTNIAEWVYQAATGGRLAGARPKADIASAVDDLG